MGYARILARAVSNPDLPDKSFDGINHMSSSSSSSCYPHPRPCPSPGGGLDRASEPAWRGDGSAGFAVIARSVHAAPSSARPATPQIVRASGSERVPRIARLFGQ